MAQDPTLERPTDPAAQAEAQRTGRAVQDFAIATSFLAQLEGIYVDDDPARA